MSEKEILLVNLIRLTDDLNLIGVFLEAYVQANGPLSESAREEFNKEMRRKVGTFHEKI